MLKIEYLSVADLIPYTGNVKEHPKKQVEQIAESIREFGFCDPVAISGDNIIIEGHGRVLAAQLLKMDKVPVIRLDGLTDEQRRAYTLVHNQLTMNTGFDLSSLEIELQGITGIDMGKYSFSIPEIQLEREQQEQHHQEMKELTQFNKANILNLEYAQFPGVGKYDIPQIKPVKKLPEIEEWISFNYMLGEKEPENKGVHFFIDDYQFERVWNQPDKYIEKLKQFACVAAPDFSPYGDMPIILQIYNHYRKHWCAAYWQAHGVTVIPTLRCSTDARSREWWLDGEPKGGIVMVSEMWASTHNDAESVSDQRDEIIKKLKPCKWLVYGEGNHDVYSHLNVEFVKSFAAGRWGK